jgi:hypothetical protein
MKNIKLNDVRGWKVFKKFIHILCYHLVIYFENSSPDLLNWIKWVVTYSDNFGKYRWKYLADEKWQPFEFNKLASHIYKSLIYIEKGENELSIKLYSELEYIAESFREKYDFDYIPYENLVKGDTELLLILHLISLVDFISRYSFSLDVYGTRFTKLKLCFKKWLLAHQMNI